VSARCALALRLSMAVIVGLLAASLAGCLSAQREGFDQDLGQQAMRRQVDAPPNEPVKASETTWQLRLSYL
jgi:hypothetical protein